ncbi:hypothetical protein ACG33_12335 [Steroidobacter denitrificans]|uniref:Peptidase M48 domain-containing protein n=1 Tax=Steroidobacter denitrificans TaxID=465721 RepID=A0A127FBS2_STEDE|nr:M48 family metallopeptidase [Steroidobacter denitrificans]AMN47872.1 hypothetical protein ACG33_12335 [Steroidobacter denitrificans]
MNFFHRQAEARRASRRLVAAFVFAVIMVVIAVDLVIFAGLSFYQGTQGYYLPLRDWMAVHPGTVVAVTLAVAGIIAGASLYKTVVLSGGGGLVAQSLGGVRVSADTTDPLQRRLLNVVEEMSIASGVPMPEVYLLEHENGINAFAAGHNPSNAAIGVTRGALTALDRAELQGVIAHEFSHILNGDMRLNLHLMGMLFGLLVIALIARTVLRLVAQVHGGDRRRGVIIPVAVVFAVTLLIVGYLGLFLGRLLQAAVSRRRESLADASAVQFTRNPRGLRDALIKIAAHAGGSRIRTLEVEQVAHMLFAPGTRRLMATHPPLIKRLKAIDPRFDVRQIEAARARLIGRPRSHSQPQSQGRPQRRAAGWPQSGTAQTRGDVIRPPEALVIVQQVGSPGTAHMQSARKIRESLPETLIAAGQRPDSARALLLALALNAPGEVRELQIRFIDQELGTVISAEVAGLQDEVDRLMPTQRIPALLRGYATLRQLSREARVELVSCLNGMMQRGGKGGLHSYVLRKLAQVHLLDELQPVRTGHALSLRVVRGDIQVLFSVLARHGHSDGVEARRAYEAGVHHLYPRERPAYAVPGDWARLLDASLGRLDRLAPAAKERLVEALLKTVAHDGRLTLGEAELLRAICAGLHCPLPPVIDSDA